MKKALIIARKDLSSYFYSWLGILIFVSFFAVTGVLFSVLMTSYARISADAIRNAYQNVESLQMTPFIFGSFFLNLGIIVMFLVPLISMKSFAEERNQQTTELLFTYPLTDFDIVFGKFFGLIWFMGLLLLPTLGYLCIYLWLGGNLDIGPVFSGYIGLVLLTCAFLALGLFVSSLTGNTVISALTTFSFLTLLWSLEWIAAITDGKWTHVIRYFSPLSHYREFTFGILDLSHIAYFVFFMLYFLFLSMRSVETRNWKK